MDYREITMVTNRLPLRIPESRLPMLVTGVSGVTGLNTFAFLRQRYGDRVLGQRRSQHPRPRPDLDCAVLAAGDDAGAVVAPSSRETGPSVGLDRLLRPPVLADQLKLALG